VRRCKAAPGPYRYAAELGVKPASLILVAAHPWDCAGARATGLRSAWVRRSRPHWPAVSPAPGRPGPGFSAILGALPALTGLTGHRPIGQSALPGLLHATMRLAVRATLLDERNMISIACW
jgi:hypothetical protein